jgi:hypothetical protein
MAMMKYKKIFILLAGALLLGCSFALFYKVKAADQTTISISPLTFDLSANPGDTVTNEFLIRNSGTEQAVISAEAQDFVAAGEGGDVNLTDEKTTYSLASWIEMDTSQFVLEGGQQKRIKFVIRVPFNAEPGGHYASVFAHLSPTLDNATSGSGVGQKIGALVLLRVGGDAKEEASIASFGPSKNVYAKGPVEFDLRVKNTGSVHIKPTGIIAITDIFGKKVSDVTVDQNRVLPGATRKMTATWKNPPLMGKFTATLLTYYGTENKQLSAATTFWIIPWTLIISWTIGIIVVALALWLNRRRIQNAIKAFINSK